ncbi:MAG: hypothetical protein EP317_06010 [Bacillota bacterium]|nr:MAG: hypothetical protein EP317_06010 [Bacillota bacterium]
MKYSELLEHAKQLNITDQREIFVKVIIPRSFLMRLLRSANRRYGYQSMGRNGFIGLFGNQFVCYTSNMWGTIPKDEKVRIDIHDITDVKKKLGTLGINKKMIIKTDKRKYKYYYQRKNEDIVDLMIKTVLSQ